MQIVCFRHTFNDANFWRPSERGLRRHEPLVLLLSLASLLRCV
jgi:hypothetical protein